MRPIPRSLFRRLAFLPMALLATRGVAAQPATTPLTNPSATTPAPAPTALVAEAQAFMTSYAADLRAGARESLAARYAPDGTQELLPGEAEYSTQQEIAARYAGQWSPPHAFEWRDLRYDVVGPDAVVVSGTLAWTSFSMLSPTVQSYVALLRRQNDGTWRIALEAEAPMPPVWFLVTVAGVLLGAGFALGWLLTRWRMRRAA